MSTAAAAQPPTSLRLALLIWLGQAVSLLGSGLTSFGLGVWTYQSTGGVTRYALIMLCATLPGIVLGPLAGALVDRWDRRWVMVLSDSAAGLSTLAVTVLLWRGLLQPWHVYLSSAVASAASAFQGPAFAVLLSTLVPVAHLGRMNGLVQLGLASSQLLAPLASAWLLGAIGLQGILLLDAATFLLAVLPLLVLRLPQAHTAPAPHEQPPPLLESIRAGGLYLASQPGLRVLLLLLAGGNFFTGAVEVLVTPLVLSLADVKALGALNMAGGLGLLAGSVVMSAWGGPERKVYGVLLTQACCGLALMGVGLTTTLPLLAAIAFAFFFGIPILNSACHAIFQRKVPLELRGRVFALMGTVSGAMLPLAYTLSGPLADRVFEPALRPGGALVPLLGGLVGTGPGRGIALMFMLSGGLTLAVALLAALYGPLRRVEQEEASPSQPLPSLPG